jgi:hypothetical protein
MSIRHNRLAQLPRAAAAIMLAASGAAALAQNNPGGNLHDNSGLNGSLSRADLDKMNGLKQGAPDASQNTPEARAKTQAQGVDLMQQLQIDCEAPEVTLVVAGTSRSEVTGKTTDAKVYEVACRSGLGYLLETQASGTPIAISCLAAEAARVADEEKHRPPGFFCRTAQNRDVKAAAATLLAGADVRCAVRDWKWYGRSATSQSEYSEVACDDGRGFVLRTPMPGAHAAAVATACSDAVAQGIHCKLTEVAPPAPAVTLDTFRAALAKNGISCAVDQIREIGQEDIHKRYVVEYLCARKPSSDIALIPLAANTNPFQVLSCAAAVDIGVQCALKPRP